MDTSEENIEQKEVRMEEEVGAVENGERPCVETCFADLRRRYGA
jgi:hypothetical protein